MEGEYHNDDVVQEKEEGQERYTVDVDLSVLTCAFLRPPGKR